MIRTSGCNPANRANRSLCSPPQITTWGQVAGYNGPNPGATIVPILPPATSGTEQFFIALRHMRRTVEFVLYPEESHVYGSAGRVDRRVDRRDDRRDVRDVRQDNRDARW